MTSYDYNLNIFHFEYKTVHFYQLRRLKRGNVTCSRVWRARWGSFRRRCDDVDVFRGDALRDQTRPTTDVQDRSFRYPSRLSGRDRKDFTRRCNILAKI